MAVYRIRELLDCLYQLSSRGCDFAEIDCPALTISDPNTRQEKTLLPCRSDERWDSDSDDDTCYEISFSYDEMATIASALANVGGIYQKAIEDDGYDPREREAFLVMQAKASALTEKIKQAFQSCK